MDVFTITLVVLVGLVVLFFAVFIYYAKHHVYYTKVVAPRTADWVFLEIQMPKDTKGDDAKGQSTEERKGIIAIGEQLFTALSAVGKSGGLLGSKEYFTFEIACTDKKISFYVNCPRNLQDLVEKQVHAQYPHAFIDEVPIYNPFPAGAEVHVAELGLAKPYFYPFRTYKNMESDPLNAVTNAMSKLEADEGAAVQFVLVPAGTDWQKEPRKIASEIQQGKSPESVTKSGFDKFVDALWKAGKQFISGYDSGGSDKKDL